MQHRGEYPAHHKASEQSVSSKVSPSKKESKSKSRGVSLAGLLKSRSFVVALIVLALAVATVVVLWLVRGERQADVPQSAVAAEYAARLPELKKATQENSDDPEVHKNYAVALYATGDTKEAQKQYERVVKLNDKDAVAFNNLGNVYRDNQQLDKAINAYKKAIEINKASMNSYVNLANVQLYLKDDADAAIKTYQQGLEALPKNTQLELLLAIAYEHKNDAANAKKTYQNILSRDAKNAAAKAAMERLE